MLKYNIKALCTARGITQPIGYLEKSGITYQKAHMLIANKVASIKPAVLEKNMYTPQLHPQRFNGMDAR